MMPDGKSRRCRNSPARDEGSAELDMDDRFEDLEY